MNCSAYKQTYRHFTVLRQWSDKGRPYWLRLCSDSLSQPAVTPSLCSSDALKRQRSIQSSPLPPAAAYSLTWGFLWCLFFSFGSMKQIWTLINIMFVQWRVQGKAWRVKWRRLKRLGSLNVCDVYRWVIMVLFKDSRICSLSWYTCT